MQLDTGNKKSVGAPGHGLSSKVVGKAARSVGSAVSRRLSKNNSGGSGGGGSVRQYSAPVSSNSSGRYSAPGPVPSAKAGGGAIPSIGNFLTRDTGYQQQLRQFAKAMHDFGADVTRRRGSLTSEYGLSQKAMGDQKLKDLDSLEEDYGSRGLLRSGLYAGAVGDYNTEYGQRMSDLQRRQNEALNQLSQEQSQFGSQSNLQKQSAREAAIRRRAEQFGM